MVANNIRALLWYIFLRIVTLFSNFVIGFNSSKIESQQDGINRMNFQIAKTWTIAIIVIILYNLIGRFTLKDQGTRVKNIMSVSLIYIVGLILCIMISLGFLKSESLYYMYTSAFSPFFTSNIKEGGLLMQLPYAIIPSLIMGISIKSTNA
ncbi:hypothetical protein [Clostridium folliculivorans]|uniref:Uncharacterized protein n=1 Tax=Clostridium folliculivorans TaxID=2886038 RepID=A0A9W6DAL7_9CLOT|nr:hypothetical protein [Clostridium folliculivorans]GKU25096.1 hypothetical protein CFOLD11_19220 [Clostridium folliculivorans]GKU31194.1 hypothetical protein CFB3_33010 [Clostridium folliculivorans]